MKKDIIINATSGETRIALLEDDQLAELFLDRPDAERMVGSLYKGTVRKVVAGMSAAFIDIGFTQDAFLHFSDVGSGNALVKQIRDLKHDDEWERKGGQQRWNASDMKVGDEIVVQVIKEPIGHKGPRVSSQISLPGRFVVLVPCDNSTGISQKIIQANERRRIKQITDKIRPKGFGLIVRTVAEGRSGNVIQADVERSLRTWRKIEREIRELKGPGVVYRDMAMTSSVIRDLFSSDVNSLVVDSSKLNRELHTYLKDVSPNLLGKLKLFRQPIPIFDSYGIEKEIEKSLSRKIWLSSGGYVYFDPTEALYAIDVNSGRFSGKSDHEGNALKVNLQAVKEITRQLRLRDIGGLIVIDFIDMDQEQNRQKVLEEMVKAMRSDRAKWDIAPLSPFGLMEMTRQRIRPSLLQAFRETCPHCEGTGMVASLDTVLVNLERWIKRFVAHTRERRLTLTVHPKVKEHLSGGINTPIMKMMWSNKLFITLNVDPNLRLDLFRGYSYRQNRDVTDDFLTSNYSPNAKKQRSA